MFTCILKGFHMVSGKFVYDLYKCVGIEFFGLEFNRLSLNRVNLNDMSAINIYNL